MKHFHQTICSLIPLWLVFFFCTNTAFAQDASSESSAVNTDNNASQVVSYRDWQKEKDYDWQKESALYQGLGWGFFWAGALTITAGSIVMVMDHETNDESMMSDSMLTFCICAGIGGLAVLTGAGLLIAEAVKFNPYRRGEVAHGFTWQPQFFASPEMSGFGFIGRF